MSKKQKPTLNEFGTHVWLHNPETGGTWEAPVDVAETFVSHRGWEYAAAPDTSLDGLFDPIPGDVQEEADEQTFFDPNDHTVEEINNYLSEHAHSAPGEVERVLGLEQDGQNRKTVVDPRPGDDSTTPSGD